MKPTPAKSHRGIALVSLIASAVVLPTQAQETRLQLDQLDKLEAVASESVDVTLDGRLLQLATMFFDSKNPEEATIKELVGGLKGIYVKVLEFDQDGEYSPADLDSIRSQLRTPGWSRMVGVKSKKDRENVDIFMLMTGNQVGGFAIIAAEPKQLTVVNIVGTLDLDKLMKLSGKFGIPPLDVKIENKEKAEAPK